MQILREPVTHPSAWTGEAMRRTREWVLDWSPESIAELETAAMTVKAAGKSMPSFTRQDFPLPRTAAFLERAMREVTNGRGFVLLRGLPVHKYDDAMVRNMLWGLGLHWGTPVTQNVAGDPIAVITDKGLDASQVGVKPSMTNAEQRPHSDPSGVAALLCIRGAKSGGVSRIASSIAIYNRLLGERPEGLECLYQGFHHDLRGDETPDAPFGCTPVPIPVYRYHQGLLSCVFNATSVRQALRRMNRTIPEEHLAMLDRIVELAHGDEFRLDMTFEPGDIQLLNNYTVLHWRTAYEDWPEPDRKRRLYRLWIDRPGERPVDPAMHRGYITGSRAGLPVAA
jgi:hypothetical protein